MFYFLLYVVTQVILLGAWVSGTLDPYQKRLQEAVLYMMGETKVSYGLKSKFDHVTHYHATCSCRSANSRS